MTTEARKLELLTAYAALTTIVVLCQIVAFTTGLFD